MIKLHTVSNTSSLINTFQMPLILKEAVIHMSKIQAIYLLTKINYRKNKYHSQVLQTDAEERRQYDVHGR